MQRQSFLPLLNDYYQQVLIHALNPTMSLLADGLDTLTDKPVYWTYPDGSTAIMSNFASQQNFLRGLCGMTQVTGDEKWQQTAEQVTHYFLDNYCDGASGLFNWGGHRFINQQTGEIEGPASKERVHELKHHFPFYDFLHQVDAKKLKIFYMVFGHHMCWIGKNWISVVMGNTDRSRLIMYLPIISQSLLLILINGQNYPRRWD